jgi:uncharacterized protein
MRAFEAYEHSVGGAGGFACQFDDEHSEEEERWITLGLDSAGVLLVVCHTFREEKEAGRVASAKIRLISARQADRREAGQYQGT